MYLNAQSKQWRNLLFQVITDHPIYLFHICCQLLFKQQSRVFGFNLNQGIHSAGQFTILKRKTNSTWSSTKTLKIGKPTNKFAAPTIYGYIYILAAYVLFKKDKILPVSSSQIEQLMVIVDAVESSQQHHWLSVCVEGAAKELKNWIANRLRYHCCPVSSVHKK